MPLHAGFWRRAAAALLDSFVLLVPNIALSFIVPGEVLTFIVQVLVDGAYYAWMHSSPMQATVGKLAFGIKVTDLSGERIGLPNAIGRYFAMWLSTLLLCIGFLLAAFTGKKQALHDMICGTLVVNRKATAAEVAAGGDTMPVTRGVWAMVVLLIALPFFGGILAAIAIPAYQDYTVRSRMADVFASAIALQGQVEQAHAQKRPWTVGPAAVESRFAKSAEITADGQIVITLADDVAKNGRIRYVPTATQGAIQWQCSVEDVQPRYLPARCRR